MSNSSRNMTSNGSSLGDENGLVSSNSSPTQLLEVTFLAVLIGASLVLNFSVGFVIWQHKQLRRRTTNVFILNLVFSNASISVLVMPLSLYALLKEAWMLNGILCKLNSISSTTIFLVSIYTLCCISLDRYLAVVRPMHYKQLATTRRCLYVLLGVWVGALTSACVPLIAFYRYEFHPGTCRCSPSLANGCGFNLFMTIAGFILPVLILLVTYGMIFSKLRRHTKRVSVWSKRGSSRPTKSSVADEGIENHERMSSVNETPRRLNFDEQSINSDVFPSNATASCGQEGGGNILELVPYPDMENRSSSPQVHIGVLLRLKNRVRGLKTSGSLSQEYKIAKTGFVLVVVFFLSWGPYMLVNNCRIRKIASLWVFRTAMWLAYFSCVLNPIAYTLYSRNIRTAFSKKLHCCRASRNSQQIAAVQRNN